MATTVLTKCGFSYSTIGESECNFFLKGSENRLLASYINGTLEIFDNYVECSAVFDFEKDWDCNDFLRNNYLGKDIPIVFVDWAENGYINYLAVECDYISAKLVLQNFLDCYGEMQIIIEK